VSKNKLLSMRLLDSALRSFTVVSNLR